MHCCCAAEVFQIVAATQQCFFHPWVLIRVSVFLLQPIGFIFYSQFRYASVLLLFIDLYYLFLLAVCNCLLLVYHYRWLRFSSLVLLGMAYFLRGSFLCSLDIISFCFLCYIRYPFNACGCCCGRFWLLLLIQKCRNLFCSLSLCRHIDLIKFFPAGTLIQQECWFQFIIFTNGYSNVLEFCSWCVIK